MVEEKRMEEAEVERRRRMEELWRIQEAEKDDKEEEEELEAGLAKNGSMKNG